MENLVCIYTCEAHADQLALFKSLPLYDNLINSNHRVIEVYSGGTQTKFSNGKLICKGTESYNALSIKTYEMIDYCVKNFNFDHLIKVDCTLAYDDTTTEKWKQKFTPSAVNEFVNKFNYLDYDGIHYQNATMLSFKLWANRKNVSTGSVSELIGSNTTNGFYTGKCYSMSKRFCEFISKRYKTSSYLYAERYGGIEDLFIGKSYYNFRVINQIYQTNEN